MDAALKTYAHMPRAKTVMNRRKLQACQLGRLVPRLQQGTVPDQFPERLVKMRPLMPDPAKQDVRMLKTSQGMKLPRRKMRRTAMPRRRPLPLMQKMSVVLAKQPQCDATTMHKQMPKVVQCLKDKQKAQGQVARVTPRMLLAVK